LIQRVDLHTHTCFSEWKHLRLIKPRDSYSDPEEVYRRCRELGLDYVAITDHDTIEGALHLLSRRPELEPFVIVGEEVETHFPDTGQWVHVNVFDIDERAHDEITRLKPNIYDLVAWLRQRGIFHVLNHPFQSYRIQKPGPAYIEEILELFDHFEVGNATLSSRHNRTVAEMIRYAGALYSRKTGVGGSDAHYLGHLGMQVTEADASGGKREWLAAVARGDVSVTGRSIGAASLTANVYRIIGQYYLSLRDPKIREGMRATNYAAAAALAPACIAGLPAFLNLGNSLRLEAVSYYLRRTIRKLQESEPAAASDLIGDSPD